MCVIVWPGPWCATDELGELGSIKFELMEKSDLEVVELRGIDLGDEILQIFADSNKQKMLENGENGACGWGQTSVFQVGGRSRGLECEHKSFELGQRGQASDDCLGCD